jgi:hypothetical protein
VERPKRLRGGIAPGRVAGQAQCPLTHIAALIDSGGQITIGALRPIACAAIANDEHDCLAMLQRKPAETLQQLLGRLDAAIELAWATGNFTDEVNVQPRTKRR